MRASEPVTHRLRRARRGERCTGRSSVPATRRSSCCRRGRSSTRASGRRRCPYLARHFRVVTFDGRGCGRSDRPPERRPTATSSSPPTRLPCSTRPTLPTAVLVGLSCGTLWGVQVAADHPDRVRAVIVLSPPVPLAPTHPDRTVYPFAERLDTTDGWAKYNRHYWIEGGYRDFLEFFARAVLHRAALDQADRGLRRVGAGHRAGDAGGRATKGSTACGLASFRSVCERVRAPVLVIHGDERRPSALRRRGGARRR